MSQNLQKFPSYFTANYVLLLLSLLISHSFAPGDVMITSKMTGADN